MYLVDLSSGGTIYAWGGTVSGTLQPIAQTVQWNDQVQMTQMPIPLQNIPLLLNFGGAQPSVTITWLITGNANYTGTAAGDWSSLSSQNWGSNTSGYTLTIPEIGGVSYTGFIYSVQLNYQQGQPNVFTCSMTIYVGTVV